MKTQRPMVSSVRLRASARSAVRRTFWAACVVGAAVSSAHAQWTVVSLNAVNSFDTGVYSVFAGREGGYVYVVGGFEHAALWSGTPASLVDLNPTGCPYSLVNGVSATQQVGWAQISNVSRASLWSGTAASRVDLNPAGVDGSAATSISGNQPSWVVAIGDAQHACRLDRHRHVMGGSEPGRVGVLIRQMVSATGGKQAPHTSIG